MIHHRKSLSVAKVDYGAKTVTVSTTAYVEIINAAGGSDTSLRFEVSSHGKEALEDGAVAKTLAAIGRLLEMAESKVRSQIVQVQLLRPASLLPILLGHDDDAIDRMARQQATMGEASVVS